MTSRKFFLTRLLVLFFFSTTLLFSASRSEESFADKTTPDASLIPVDKGEGYTINFNNVPVLELVKFISKIGEVNFIYEEKDLNFNVSIISEEPTSIANILGAFIQVLRLNGLDLIEQGNNLVIAKGTGIKQIATVVSTEVPLEGNAVPPIMTRVFKVKNANPATLAGLIGPLLSQSAIIEVSEATRHIIVTDITQNIEEIHKLFYSLDIPKSSLEIDSYTVKNNSPDNLISLANEILIPVSEGNPLIFVPQASTNTIFIVSTPFLVEKSIALIEDLDSPPSIARGIRGPLTSQNILIYHIQNKPADVLQAGVREVEANLSKLGPSSQNLVQALSSMKFVQQSHSLLFTGDATSLTEVRTILDGLDVPYSEQELEHMKGGFYIYKIENGDEEQMARALEKLVQNLKKAPYPDSNLIETIDSMKWIKESNSLMFTGDQRSLNKLKQLLPTFDVAKHEAAKLPIANDFFIYTPKNETPEELYKEIQETYTSLKNSNLSDPAFLNALSSAKVSKSQGTVTFTGDPQSLNRIRSLVTMMDAPKGLAPEQLSTFIYQIQYVSPERIEKGLQKIGKSLSSDEDLEKTIDDMKYISESNSFVFRGPKSAIEQLREILPSLDNASVASTLKPSYFVYKLENAPGNVVLKELQQTAKTIKSSDAESKELIASIDNIKWIQSSNSLVITGPSSVIDQIKGLIAKYDNPQTAAPTSSSFYVYKPTGETPKNYRDKIIAASKEMEDSGLDDPSLISAMKSATLVSNDTAVMFTGTPQSIAKLKDIAPTFDLAKKTQASDFYMYKPQSISPEKLIEDIKRSADQLQNSGLKDPELIQAMESAKLSSNKNQVIFTGTPEAIDKVKVLVGQYDSLEGQSQTTHYYIFKPENQKPEAFIKQVKHAANQMEDAGLADPKLIKALDSATIVSNGTGILFTGTNDAIEQVKQIAPTFDTPIAAHATTSQYYIFRPENQKPESIIKQVKHTADRMEDAGLADPRLISALNSATIVSNGTGIMFTGTNDAIERVKEIVPSFDTAAQETAKTTEYYIFKPENQKPEAIIKQSEHAADEMKDAGLADPNLIKALSSATVVSNGTGVLYTGTPASIERIKQLAPTFDSAVAAHAKTSQYYIFKPEHQTPDAIIKQAEHAADEMKDAGLADPDLIAALDSGTVVSKGTGVLFTGTQGAIDRLRDIIPTFDIPVEKAPQANEFYVYKPTHISADDLRRHARMVAVDMESSGFADKGVISTLTNTRLVSNGKGVLFTGTQSAIEKVQTLLPMIDSPSDDQIKQVGKTTFQIYKIKYLSGPALMGYLRNMSSDLKRAGSNQDDLLFTLNNMRYVQDTNSIIFTGTPSAVQEAIALAQKFDIPGLAQEAPVRAPAGYLIYKPKFVPGEELIRVLRDFEQNLMTSGVSDKNLFDVINNLKWMEKTSSVLISGDEAETKKVYDLLERFDTPRPGIPEGEPGVETVSDMSFLIYKLQYHSGSAIQDAIKLIGQDLAKAKTKVNDNLVDAINTLQWIEVTNSLIATGQAEALGKLKELIKSVDVPLKQVFVEILVIETSLSNNLQFGLRWGSQGQYRNKFGWGFGGFPSEIGGVADPLIAFKDNLHSIDATTTPKGSFIPFVSGGGDLGIIGDIVLHKGQSYFALGSLVNAVKDEGDTVIVMNQKIVAQDNKMSTIFTGQNIPYTGSFVSNQSQNTISTSNIEYRDVGVSLSITPVIGNNDVVTLMIEEDISESTNQGDTSSTVSNVTVTGITTNKSSTKTVVSVPDKSFLVLSGSMRDSKVYHKTGIPCLGGLPIIGAAFSDNEKSNNISNLVIFVRPHIIKSFDTYQEITERQEDLYRSQTIAEDFDAGLELVKTPDDTY
ncbi:MAG: hypothetical protein KDK71_04495 [Chlamydiia bacterium]|nr:hypothetical protein [Chlamydiia bacterium]